MRKTLLASAALLGIAMALPAFAQTATDPNPANPSAIKDGTPAAGTGSGSAPGNDPAASGKTGATLGSRAPQGDPGPLGNTVNPAPTDNAPSASQDSGSMAAPSSGADTGKGMSSDTPAPAAPSQHEQGRCRRHRPLGPSARHR